jgi:hypothetical protein
MTDAMPAVLEPRIDCYGSKARVSALLDFAEVLALSGREPTVSLLVEYLEDNDWIRRVREHYEDLSAADDPDEGEGGFGSNRETAAERLRNLVAERALLLEGCYPFQFEDDRLRYLGGSDSYIFLLAATMAHAYSDVLACPDPTEVFPGTVARVLGARSFRSTDVGACRVAGAGFIGTVQGVAVGTGLPVGVVSGMASISANDEGVDVVAHLEWDAGRPGTWVFMGQVTCAKSDRWEAKLDEVAASRWRRYLGLVTTPFEFLAVPHHAEPGHLRYLCEKDRGVVLDRLRLAPWVADLTADEVAIIDAVRSAELPDF